MLNEHEFMIVSILSELLNRPPDSIDIDEPLAVLGIDSFLGLRFIGKLSDSIGVDVDPLFIFDCTSIRAVAAKISSKK